jgi:integral membrane protein
MNADSKAPSSNEIRFSPMDYIHGRAVPHYPGLYSVPVKYLGDDPSLVKTVGPIHGFLFILFCYSAWLIGSKLKWNWSGMIWKLLLASFIPFGYVLSRSQSLASFGEVTHP